MNTSRLLIVAMLAALSTAAGAEEERHQLGPHEHGHGTLNIAIEDGKLAMELRVPAADIVGFEHAPETDEQKSALETAKTQLSAPLAHFEIPAEARCRVAETTVEIDRGESHDGADDGAAHHHDRDETGEAHSEFHADYVLECALPEEITHIAFPYFETFQSAEELDVSIITAKGQSRFEVSREQPRLDVGGMI